MARHRRGVAGVTLIELLVALTILSLLLTLAVPAYGRWMAEYRQRNQAQALAAALTLARSEAIKHGFRVNVCKSRDGRLCADDGGWTPGWLMHTDDNANGQVDDDEDVVRAEPAPPDKITIVGNRPVADYVSYTSLGHARLSNGALQMGTFTVCSSGLTALKVILANSGRVRIVKTSEPCA